MYKDLTIILPTLNEAGNIESLIKQIKYFCPESTIIVADDQSSDGTYSIVKNIALDDKNVKAHLLEAPKSLPKAIQYGIDQAKTDYVCWMDADHSHPVCLIPHLYIDAKKITGCCIASRYLKIKNKKNYFDNGALLRLFSSILNYFIKKLINTKITDYTSGFIVIKKSLLVEHKIKGNYGEYFIELVSYLESKNYNIQEKAYISPPRVWGYSKTTENKIRLIKRGFDYLLLSIKIYIERRKY